MFDVLKLIAKEISYKEKIDSKLKSIKDAFDWSTFGMEEMCDKVDVTDLYQFNQINETSNWSHIAKLSINLYLDYEFFKDFVFLNKHRGRDYDYRLSMLGYIDRDGYWTSTKRPENESVIENIFIGCFYESISKRLQPENGGHSDTGDAGNAVPTASVALDIETCPFCDFGPVIKDQGCGQCGASRDDIDSFNREPVGDRAETELSTRQTEEAARTRLVEDKLACAWEPEAVNPPPDRGETCAIQNDRESLDHGVDSIANGMQKFGYTQENSGEKKTTLQAERIKDHRDKEKKADWPNIEIHAANVRNCADVAVQWEDTKQVPEVSSVSQWRCELCQLLNDQSQVWCEVCFADTVLLWTCPCCHVDNVMPSNQCVECGMSRFCKRCSINESVNESLCANCLAKGWQCWYKSCKNVNFGTNTIYCEKCGLSRQVPILPVVPVYQKTHDITKIVWICDKCQQINDNRHRICSNYQCRTERNTNFIWCTNCGWGHLSILRNILRTMKCKYCNGYLS